MNPTTAAAAAAAHAPYPPLGSSRPAGAWGGGRLLLLKRLKAVVHRWAELLSPSPSVPARGLRCLAMGRGEERGEWGGGGGGLHPGPRFSSRLKLANSQDTGTAPCQFRCVSKVQGTSGGAAAVSKAQWRFDHFFWSFYSFCLLCCLRLLYCLLS